MHSSCAATLDGALVSHRVRIRDCSLWIKMLVMM